jgi:hypothetical protein
MVRLAIIDSEGRSIQAGAIASAMDLVRIVEQARTIIRDCEQIAREKQPKNGAGTGRAPYSS